MRIPHLPKTTMPNLILIKHAKPQKDESTPSREWKLSDEGRSLSAVLADQLEPHTPQIVISSDEPKAVETAQIIAEKLNIPTEIEKGLAEHNRDNVPMMQTREFIASMALLFNRPRQLVLGNETAEQARKRFSQSIDSLLDRHGQSNLAIVTHGTVLALYAGPLLEIPPFHLWRQMGLPAYLVFDRPSMNLIDRRDAVE